MEGETPSTGIVLRLYRDLVRFFPHRFRCAFEREMLETTEEAGAWITAPELVRARVSVCGSRSPTCGGAPAGMHMGFSLRGTTADPKACFLTFVAAVSMSLAICAGSSFFSELNGTILRDVPGVTRAEELVTLQQPISYPAYRRFRDLKDLFFSTSAYIAPVPFGVSSNGHTERIWGHIVTPSLFFNAGSRRGVADACLMHTMKPSKERQLDRGSATVLGKTISARIRTFSAGCSTSTGNSA